jgi:hypothetical protein
MGISSVTDRTCSSRNSSIDINQFVVRGLWREAPQATHDKLIFEMLWI